LGAFGADVVIVYMASVLGVPLMPDQFRFFVIFVLFVIFMPGDHSGQAFGKAGFPLGSFGFLPEIHSAMFSPCHKLSVVKGKVFKKCF
jgi:hypothetical protein